MIDLLANWSVIVKYFQFLLVTDNLVALKVDFLFGSKFEEGSFMKVVGDVKPSACICGA